MPKETRYIVTASINGKRVSVFRNRRSYKCQIVAEKRAAWFAILLDSVRVDAVIEKVKKK